VLQAFEQGSDVASPPVRAHDYGAPNGSVRGLRRAEPAAQPLDERVVCLGPIRVSHDRSIDESSTGRCSGARHAEVMAGRPLEGEKDAPFIRVTEGEIVRRAQGFDRKPARHYVI
jgi:hypothetical protein